MTHGKDGDTTLAQVSTGQLSVTPDLLREAFRRHAEGMTIITTVDEFGNEMGITDNAVTSGSLDPPMVLVCIGNRSWMLGPLTAGVSFIVHFLAAEQEHIARQFTRPGPDKFEGTSYQFARSGCPASGECWRPLNVCSTRPSLAVTVHRRRASHCCAIKLRSGFNPCIFQRTAYFIF